MDQVKIGKFIAELRKEKNLTQEELANILGVTSKSVSRWETGKTMPDYSILKDLCRVLDTTINELLNGKRVLEETLDNTIYNVYGELDRIKRQRNRNKIVLIICLIIALLQVLPVLLSLIFSIEFTNEKHDVTKYNEYLTELKDNKTIKSDFLIFPTNIDINNIEKISYTKKGELIFSKKYTLYLIINYNSEELAKEEERLHNMEVNINYKDDINTICKQKKMYTVDTDTYLTIYDDNRYEYEYATIDRNNNQVIYIYSRYRDLEDTNIDTKYLLNDLIIPKEERNYDKSVNLYYGYDNDGNNYYYTQNKCIN